MIGFGTGIVVFFHLSIYTLATASGVRHYIPNPKPTVSDSAGTPVEP